MRKVVLLVEKVPVVLDQWQAQAHIALGYYTQDAKVRVLLSPDCRTAAEVHTWADDLIKELQEVKRRALNVEWDNHPALGGRTSRRRRET